MNNDKQERKPRSASPPAGTKPSIVKGATSAWIGGTVALAFVCLVGFVVYHVVHQQDLPPAPAPSADNCVREALGLPKTADISVEVNIVEAGTFTVGSKPSAITVPDEVRIQALQTCRAAYAKAKGLPDASAKLSVPVLATVVRHVGPREFAVNDATVSVENVAGVAPCDTRDVGRCQVHVHGLALEEKIVVVAAKGDGSRVASVPTSLMELLRSGIKLTLEEGYPVLSVSVVDCNTRQALQNVDIRIDAGDKLVWTGCGPNPPEKPESCRSTFARAGVADFYYLPPRPDQLTITVTDAGARRDSRVVTPDASSIEVLMPRNCSAVKPDCAKAQELLVKIARNTRLPEQSADWSPKYVELAVRTSAAGRVQMLTLVDGSREAERVIGAALRGASSLPGPCPNVSVRHSF